MRKSIGFPLDPSEESTCAALGLAGRAYLRGIMAAKRKAEVSMIFQEFYGFPQEFHRFPKEFKLFLQGFH